MRLLNAIKMPLRGLCIGFKISILNYDKNYRWAPFHFEYPCWGFGHFCHGSKPDHDVNAWKEADEDTKTFLKKWLDHCCIQRVCEHGKDKTLKKCKWVRRAEGKCTKVQPKMIHPTMDQYMVEAP